MPSTLLIAIASPIVVLVAWGCYQRPLDGLWLAIALIPWTVSLAGGGASSGPASLGTGGVSPSEALFALLALTWTVRRLVERKLPWSRTPLAASLALLVVSMLPGVLVASSPHDVIRILAWWTVFFVLSQLLVAEASTPDALRRFWSAAVVAGTWTAIVALLQWAGLDAMGQAASNRVIGPFQQPNTLGGVLALLFPFVAIKASMVSGPHRVAYGLCASSIALAVVASGSRGGLLALIAATALLFCGLPAFRRVAIVGTVILALGYGIMAMSESSPFPVGGALSRLGSTSSAASVDVRNYIYEVAPRIWGDHPIAGIGAGNFVYASPAYGLVDPVSNDVVPHAHNIALTFLSERGLIGFSAALLLLVALAPAAVRALRVDRPVAVAALAALAALLTQGLFDYLLTTNFVIALVFCIFATVSALAAQPRVAPHGSTSLAFN